MDPSGIAWKRARFHHRAHAFAEIDLAAGFSVIEPIAPCGRFTVHRLIPVPSDYPHRCPRCLHAMTN
jgi:hypothetical protein